MEEVKSKEDYNFSDESKQSESDSGQDNKEQRNRITSSGVQQMDGSLIIQEQKKNRFQDISPIKQNKQTSFIKVGSMVDLKNSQTQFGEVKVPIKNTRKYDRNNLNQMHNMKGIQKEETRDKSSTFNAPMPIRDTSLKSSSNRSTLKMKNHLVQSTINLDPMQINREKSMDYQSQISQSKRKKTRSDELNFKNQNIN